MIGKGNRNRTYLASAVGYCAVQPTVLVSRRQRNLNNYCCHHPHLVVAAAGVVGVAAVGVPAAAGDVGHTAT